MPTFWICLLSRPFLIEGPFPGLQELWVQPQLPPQLPVLLSKPVHGGDQAERNFQGQTLSSCAAPVQHTAQHKCWVRCGLREAWGQLQKKEAHWPQAGSWQLHVPHKCCGWARSAAPSMGWLRAKGSSSPSHSGMHLMGGEQRRMACKIVLILSLFTKGLTLQLDFIQSSGAFCFLQPLLSVGLYPSFLIVWNTMQTNQNTSIKPISIRKEKCYYLE